MPFESPNHTQIPNDLFDVLLPKMGYAELKVTLAILRKTLGWQKRSDKISLTQLEDLTGLSRPAIIEGASQAEERGTISRVEGYITEWVVNLVDHPESEMVKQVYQNGKVTLPKVVKQVYPQKKGNKEKEIVPAGSVISELQSLYESNFGALTPILKDELFTALGTYGAEITRYGLEQAIKANVRRWNYAASIMERVQREGYNSKPVRKSTLESIPDL